MNLAQTLDIATRIMSRADWIIEAEEPISDAALHAYWVHSRDLSHQWLGSLAVCQKVVESGRPQRSRQCWLEYEPDVRDILRADLLQRVWYCVLCAADQRRGNCHAEPIARSAFSAHLQTRSRALQLILLGHQFDAARMKTLNQLRRTTETWADFLCAHLAQRYQLSDVLFDAARAQTWGRHALTDLLPEFQIPQAESRLQRLNRLLIQSAPEDFPLNPIQKLAATMINGFPATAFDQHGTLR